MTTTSSLTFKNDRRIAKEKLANDLRTALDDADELLKLTAAQAGERLADVRGRLQQSLAKARGQLEHIQADVSAATRSMVSAAETCVQENPWKSLGGVAVAAFVLGMLIARR